MNTTSLIGQDAYVAGLQKQAAAQAAAVQGTREKNGQGTDMKKVHEAAEKFEAFFVSQMLEHMTSGIETDPMFGGGHGEDMWKSMMNQEYGKEIAKSGRLGITEQVMKGMLKMQEQHDAAKEAAISAMAAPTAAEIDPAQQQQDAAIALVAGARAPARR
ncbi:MAG: rod-binding protein [Rhodospirillaceae bacterium]|nr:rod-binding protein [Rhodospirillaceae bacterium]